MSLNAGSLSLMPTPLAFWNEFAGALAPNSLARSTLAEAYRSNVLWTQRVLQAARAAAKATVAQSHPLQEYLRLDFACYTRVNENESNNWHLRVAFEHENDDSWQDELCKLTHVVADLRVLMSYTAEAHNGICEQLQKHVTKLEDRISRVPGNWLFAFGPRINAMTENPNHGPFSVFTLTRSSDEGSARVVPLEDAIALNARPWILPA